MSNNRSRKQRKRARRKSSASPNLRMVQMPDDFDDDGAAGWGQPLYERGTLDDVLDRFPFWLYGVGSAPTIEAAMDMADIFMSTDELVGYAAPDPLNWTALDVAALVDALDHGPQDVAAGIAVSTIEFLMFLWETGAWRGSEQDHHDVVQQLGPHVDRMVAAAIESTDLADPSSGPADPADTVFDPAKFGLFRELTVVLAAVGSGTRVTSTGVLPPAAANRLSDELGFTHTAQFRSMRDCVELMQLWAAGVEAGLIEVGSTRASLNPDGELWLSADTPPGEAALRALVCFVIQVAAGRSVDNRPGAFYAALDDAVTAVLVSGTTDAPQPVDTESDDFFSGFLLQRLGRLVSLGLLTVTGGAYVIPPAIAPIVAKAIEIAVTSDMFTVRAVLQDMDVPVWRTLELPSSMSLPLIHEVMQTAFGWNRSHLHEFDSGTTRYLPRYAEDLLDGPGTAVDETATLADLFAAVGDTADYQYDFGDGWMVEMTLESVGSAIRPRPQVTAGSGMGPADDSGGPYGWADKVRVANDPTDEEHSFIREWLGLHPTATLDPTEFDLDRVNDAIAQMFS